MIPDLPRDCTIFPFDRSIYNLQNVLGMSVVGPEFEKLKRFNIEELRQPLPTDGSEEKPTLPIKEDV